MNNKPLSMGTCRGGLERDFGQEKFKFTGPK